MRIAVVILALGLLGWLAWDKFQSKFFPEEEEPGQVEEGATEAVVDGRKGTGAIAQVNAVETAEDKPRREPPPPLQARDEVLVSYTFRNRSVPEGVLAVGDQANVFVDPQTRTVSARVDKDQVAGLVAFWSGIDKPAETHLVEMVLVVVRLRKEEDFGLNWALRFAPENKLRGLVMQSQPGVMVLSSEGLDLVLRSAESANRLSVLSRPRLVVEDGVKAEFVSGREIGVGSVASQNGNLTTSVDFRQVALSVAFTVTRLPGGYRVELEQRNDDLAGFRVVNGSEVPELATQQLRSVVSLGGATWAAVGGIAVEGRDKISEGWKGPLRAIFGQVRGESEERSEIGIFLRIGQPDELAFAPPSSVAALEPIAEIEPLPKKRALSNPKKSARQPSAARPAP